MIVSAAFIAAICVFVVGGVVIWSNPSRWVNRFVFSCSVCIGLWLMFLHLAVNAHDGLFWLRWTTGISAIIPLQFWLVKQAITYDGEELRQRSLRHAALWIVATIVLATIPFTEYFIPAHSTDQHRIYGPGYFVYITGIFALYVVLGINGFASVRRLQGEKRLTLQVWLGGGCATALTILLLMAISALTKDSRYIRLQPFAVLLYYSGTAYAITTFRIFNARELLMAGLAKASLVIAVAGVAFAADQLFVNIMAQPFTLLATAAVALAFAAVANEWLGRVFRYYPQAMAARQAALSIVQKETRIDRMVTGFSGVLKSWGHTEQALIAIVPRGDFLKLGELGQEANGAIVQVLRELQWATPERLARERYTPARGELKTYLAQHTLGGVVLTEGPAVTAIFGIGMSASRRPYTFPQMVQLMELASIMESAFERAHLSVKVQHAEQLATVGLLGASLAHEIRNPLVSIKTFVQLLPAHYQEPAFREKFFKLLGDEVDRIDHLTEQLLDLAAPRTYAATTVELHPILRASMDLVATKAAHRNVQLIADFEAKPDTVFTDAAAAKQVILNLCFNAIQALENQDERQRCVWIKTRQNGGGIEVAVSDSGPGISPEILPRLFQPFQTTKSSGFGLGLAICRDILANLNASISIDPPQPGHGATFRVNFPCQPSLS